MTTPTPSQALIDAGLGVRTTPQAVSRVLKSAGFRAHVWRTLGSGLIWVRVSAYGHTEEACAYLTRKGYAAEPLETETYQAVIVYGRRKTTRTHLDPTQYERHTP